MQTKQKRLLFLMIGFAVVVTLLVDGTLGEFYGSLFSI